MCALAIFGWRPFSICWHKSRVWMPSTKNQQQPFRCLKYKFCWLLLSLLLLLLYVCVFFFFSSFKIVGEWNQIAHSTQIPYWEHGLFGCYGFSCSFRSDFCCSCYTKKLLTRCVFFLLRVSTFLVPRVNCLSQCYACV